MRFVENLNINHRFVIYLVAVFFSLVLFNTTYLGLGTIIPIVVIGVILICLNFNPLKANKTFVPFIWYALIITIVTLLLNGETRDLSKIILMVVIVYCISLLKIDIREIKFLTLALCFSYCVYAILVIQSIGLETGFYGRVQIKILNGEIPLDPNVISATFILPIIISLYNLFYGKYKLLAFTFIVLFIMALIATASRGAFISLLVTSSLFLLKYLLGNGRKQSLFVKILMIAMLFVAVSYGIHFISSQDNLMGMDRLTDYSDGNNGRTGIWIGKLSLLQSSPLFGYGVTNYAGENVLPHACHNTFLEIFFYGGILGFMFFIIPLVRLYKRHTIPFYLKIILFLSVCLPICSIDTLQERTIWNFLIFYELLSRFENAEKGLLWNI